jgi:hypothetical protein
LIKELQNIYQDNGFVTSKEPSALRAAKALLVE